MTNEKQQLWIPISDIGTSVDFNSLSEQKILKNHSKLIHKEKEVDIDKLKILWSIETGLIENAYKLDDVEINNLLNNGIRSGVISNKNNEDPNHVISVLKDQYDTLNGIYDWVQMKRPLTTSLIKEMHQWIMSNHKTADGIDSNGKKIKISLLRGEFKKMPNNPVRLDGEIHNYCPPEHVNNEIDRLLSMHEKHNKENVHPLVKASWLHHRFIQIHPFQDGNGRVTRCIASYSLIKDGHLPFILDHKTKYSYYDSLDAANAGNLNDFIKLSYKQQKNYYEKFNLNENINTK